MFICFTECNVYLTNSDCKVWGLCGKTPTLMHRKGLSTKFPDFPYESHIGYNLRLSLSCKFWHGCQWMLYSTWCGIARNGATLRQNQPWQAVQFSSSRHLLLHGSCDVIFQYGVVAHLPEVFLNPFSQLFPLCVLTKSDQALTKKGCIHHLLGQNGFTWTNTALVMEDNNPVPIHVVFERFELSWGFSPSIWK